MTETVFIREDFAFDAPAMLRRLRLDADSGEGRDFLRLLDTARNLAAGEGPCSAARPVAVDYIGGGGRVVVGGVAFHSRSLAGTLLGSERLYAHVATCGRGLWRRSEGFASPLERYWWDEIMQDALDAALLSLRTRVALMGGEEYGSFVGPGSLADWNVREQEGVFRLLGDGPARCGVELTDAFYMLPGKSVAGFLHHGSGGWRNCGSCPRGECSGSGCGRCGGAV